MRDTATTPAFTSFLTSDPRSAIALFREKNLSLQPRVLFIIDSLYLKTPEEIQKEHQSTYEPNKQITMKSSQCAMLQHLLFWLIQLLFTLII